jgi:outer membrane protein insertion porin family
VIELKLRAFKISGTEKLSEESLLKLFKIGEADMFIMNYFTNKDLFTEAEFKQGIDLMTNAYFDSGYLDFQILNIDSQLNENKEKISIEINISEGIQYQLGKITFEGETELLAFLLFRIPLA